MTPSESKPQNTGELPAQSPQTTTKKDGESHAQSQENAEARVDDGGAAFPSPDSSAYHAMLGMSLRDYFAAKAMEYTISYCANPAISEDEANSAAKACYLYADAMLRAREQRDVK